MPRYEGVHDGEEPKSDGVRWLELIGRSDFIEKDLVLRDGSTIKGADFADVCGEDAADVFRGIEELDIGSADRQEEIDAAQALFDGHFGRHFT